jgi:hypothetical protein
MESVANVGGAQGQTRVGGKALESVAGGVDPKASGGIHGWVVHRRGKQQGAFEGPSLFVV